ncbi:MAG: ABC transporter permease [Nocardioides sp.]|nr:ABC transporter permease [Nocardioides sp.]
MKPVDPRLLPHLRPAAVPLLGVVASSLVGGVLVVGQAFALAALVVSAVSAGQGSGPSSAWTTPAVWLAVVVALRAVNNLIGEAAATRAAARVSSTLRRRVLAALGRLDPATRARRTSGAVTVLATRGTSAVEPWVVRYLPSLVTAAVLPPLTLVVIASQDLLAALVVLCTLPLVPVFAALVGMATQDKAEAQWRRLGDLSGHFLDVVRGLPTLVAHRRAGAQVAKIRDVGDRHRRATMETLRLAFASSVVLELVATLSVALVAVTVGLRLASGSVEFPVALVVLLLAPEAYWPLRRVGAEFHAAAEGAAAFAEADRVLAEADEAVDGAGSGSVRLGGAPTLEVRDLVAEHRDGVPALVLPRAVLSPGLTAVTGPSGCGKSTLLAVLAGDLAPVAGGVTVDGVGLGTLDPDDWRRHVALAPQRPWLTGGTIADNLRVAAPDADDAALWLALEAVDLGHAVATLPLGLETPLGDDGAGLSAGQRARVALARVVLADRPVVLLDEPSAHLDAETEAVLLDVLRSLARTRTVVVVAHRDAVVAVADRELRLVPPGSSTTSSTAAAPARAAARRTTVAAAAPVPEPLEDTDDPAPARREALAVLLGSLATGSGVALTATAAWLITRAADHPPVLHLMVAIVSVRLFGLARPVLRYAERLVSHDAALRDLVDLRADVYDVLVPLVPGALGRRRGTLLTTAVDDVETLSEERVRVQVPAWTGALVAAGAAVLAGTAAGPAALVVLVAAVVTALSWVAVVRGTARLERAGATARADLAAEVEQLVQGVGPLVSWQALDVTLDRVDAAATRADRATARVGRLLGLARGAVLLACGLGPVATVWLVAPGSTSGPVLALLVLLPVALADALLPVVDAAAGVGAVREARARIDALRALTPVVSDAASPVALPEPGTTSDSAGSDVDLADVEAGWGAAPALRDLDLHLAPGSRIAVVGPSGCGKSTLAALLVRFLDPTAGTVRLDGTDARTATLDDVRRRVGLVDDDPYLFSSTLAENVRLARPGSSDAEVEQAVRTAGLGAWLDAQPEGLGVHLGDGQADVSGGERARIGLARAVLADQPVLVLDEPTAHLDTTTAEQVARDVLDGAGGPDGQGRTVVWITHGTVGLDRVDDVVRLPDHRATPLADAAPR